MFGSSSTTRTRGAELSAMLFSHQGHVTFIDIPSNDAKETGHMTLTTKRAVLATVAAGVLALAAATVQQVSAQNTNQDGHPFNGSHMRPGGRGMFGPGPGGPGGPLAMLRMLGPQLNLTDAQRDQIKNLAETHREEWKALADRELTAHEALQAAIMSDTIDEGLIRSRSAELAAVQSDVAIAAAHVRAEVWPLLTADQQARIKQMQSDHQGRGRGRAQQQ